MRYIINSKQRDQRILSEILQNRKIEEIKDALLRRENQNTLINITEI